MKQLLLLLLSFNCFSQSHQLKKPKVTLEKKIVSILLKDNLAYTHVFKYDSITFFDSVKEQQIERMNTILNKDFTAFIKKHDKEIKQIVNINPKELSKMIDTNSELYDVKITSLFDYSTTFITLNYTDFWCCRAGGNSGFHEHPKITLSTTTLKPILIHKIFKDEIKNLLIKKLCNHPKLKDLPQDNQVIQQSICKDDKKDYLIHKIKNTTTSKDIILTNKGIFLVTNEVDYCSEFEKYNTDPLRIFLPYSDIKMHIIPDNPYLHFTY